MKVTLPFGLGGFVAFVACCLVVDSQASNKARFSDAAYATHMRNLKSKLPHKGFTIILEKPFVVIGDMPAAQLRTRWAHGTVRWATRKLKASYFTKDPIHILNIWLFKDKISYEKRPPIVGQQTHHSLRLLLIGKSCAGDEHRYRRRHTGA